MADPHVEIIDVGKRYGGVEALAGIDLSIERGTVHGLVGENGAGKSTLGKVIAGVVPPDTGALRVDGREVRFRGPHDALAAGLTTVAQELALVPGLSVAENVYLGSEPRRWGMTHAGVMHERYAELVARMGFGVDPRLPAGELTVAAQQKVEILRALARDARLIVFDEPTAALAPRDAAALLADIDRLRGSGTTVVFVSHFLDEVLEIADRVSVMKDGRLLKTMNASKVTKEQLITMMLGRSLDLTFPPKNPPPARSDVVLSVRGLGRSPVFSDVSFNLRVGEILGIAGLVGSGRTALARTLFGADRRTAGSVVCGGKVVAGRRPGDAMRAGIALLPESRKEQGLITKHDVLANLSLTHLGPVSRFGLIRGRRERRRGESVSQHVGLRAPLNTRARDVSGGNQQKLSLARWLTRAPRVLIADQPTRGIDVGARLAIYENLVGLVEKGMAIIVISDEIEEVLGLSHRVMVMRRGRMVRRFEGEEATEERVMAAALGADDDE